MLIDVAGYWVDVMVRMRNTPLFAAADCFYFTGTWLAAWMESGTLHTQLRADRSRAFEMEDDIVTADNSRALQDHLKNKG